jgi:zinc protease
MRSPRLTFALAALLGCAGPSATSGLLEGDLPLETLAREGDLGFDGVNFRTKQVLMPSGLRMVIEQAATRGMAGVVVTVGAGSTSDPAGKEGLAHFAEHLAFRGRVSKGATLGERLDRAGASYNAHTTLDSTKYFFFAPRAQLPLLIALANELLVHPLADVDPTGASIEHQVVVNELRQRNETRIYGGVLASLQAALFPADHPYARAIGGSPESLAKLQLADARAFATAHYRPDNATLLVIGDLTPEDAGGLIERLPRTMTGDSSSAHPPSRPTIRRAPSDPPPAPKEGYLRRTAPVSRPEAWIAWSLPSLYSTVGAQVKLVTACVVE